MDEETVRCGMRGERVVEVEDEEDEYLDSVMDGNRTFVSPVGGADLDSAALAGGMGCGLARNGIFIGSSSSSPSESA